MSRFEVAPEELRAVGANLKTTAPGVAAAATEMTIGSSVSDPPETAAALDDMAAQWFAGLHRLSDDVVVFGSLAQVAAHGYEVVDRSTMPVASDEHPEGAAPPRVVREDDGPPAPLTPGFFDPFPRGS